MDSGRQVTFANDLTRHMEREHTAAITDVISVTNYFLEGCKSD